MVSVLTPVRLQWDVTGGWLRIEASQVHKCTYFSRDGHRAPGGPGRHRHGDLHRDGRGGAGVAAQTWEFPGKGTGEVGIGGKQSSDVSAPAPAPLHSPGAFEEEACFPLPCLRPRLPANNRGWGQHWCLSPFPLHDSQLQLGQRGLGPRGSELDRSCAEPHRPTSQRLLRWVSDVAGARGSMAGVAAWCERAGGRGPPCPLSLQALTGSNHSPGYECCSAQ